MQNILSKNFKMKLLFKYYLLAGIVEFRKNFAIEQLDLHGVSLNRIVVLAWPNYSDVEASTRLSSLVLPLDSRQGAITLKHFIAICMISESEDQFGIIVEDGVLFRASPDIAVTRYLENAPDDLDIIFDSDILGLKFNEGHLHQQQLIYKKSNEKNSYCDGSSKGANFLIMAKKAAQRLRANFFPLVSVSDFHYNHLFRKLDMNVYWAEPPNVHKITSFKSTVTLRS